MAPRAVPLPPSLARALQRRPQATIGPRGGSRAGDAQAQLQATTQREQRASGELALNPVFGPTAAAAQGSTAGVALALPPMLEAATHYGDRDAAGLPQHPGDLAMAALGALPFLHNAAGRDAGALGARLLRGSLEGAAARDAGALSDALLPSTLLHAAGRDASALDGRLLRGSLEGAAARDDAALGQRLTPRAAGDSVVSQGARAAFSGGNTQALTPTAATLEDTPEVVANRVAKLRASLQQPVTPQPPSLGILDRSGIQPDAGPTAAPLPARPGYGPRQSTGHMRDLPTDQNAELVKLQMLHGLKFGAPATFYPSYQAVDQAIGQLGGDTRLFRNATSGAAIRSSVPDEIVGGTQLYAALRSGFITPEEIAHAEALGGKAGVAEWTRLVERVRTQARPDWAETPRLMGIHLQSTRNLYTGKAPDSFKIPTFDAQKAGDVPGFVFDTHESKGGTAASRFHRHFAGQAGYKSEGEYGTMEQFYRPIAQSLGLSDRTAQAARWAGGGLFTGLETPANLDYAQIFEGLLHRNARLRGMDPSKLLEGVAQGRQGLLPVKRGVAIP